MQIRRVLYFFYWMSSGGVFVPSCTSFFSSTYCTCLTMIVLHTCVWHHIFHWLNFHNIPGLHFKVYLLFCNHKLHLWPIEKTNIQCHCSLWKDGQDTQSPYHFGALHINKGITDIRCSSYLLSHFGTETQLISLYTCGLPRCHKILSCQFLPPNHC